MKNLMCMGPIAPMIMLSQNHLFIRQQKLAVMILALVVAKLNTRNAVEKTKLPRHEKMSGDCLAVMLRLSYPEVH